MAAPSADDPLVINAEGLIEIPDHKDEVHKYLALPAPEGLDEWAVTLRRMDLPEGQVQGHPYRVARTPGGRWRCTCKSWRYRKGPHAPAGCKHTAAAARLYLILMRMTRRELSDA